MTQDAELYQSERWGSEDFSYKIPLENNGKYVLVLKFSEVYFNSPSEKIFDVTLGKDTVVKHLDIYSKVGKATAYDEFVEFELKNNKVYLNVDYNFNWIREDLLMELTMKKPKLSLSLSKKAKETTRRLTPFYSSRELSQTLTTRLSKINSKISSA